MTGPHSCPPQTIRPSPLLGSNHLTIPVGTISSCITGWSERGTRSRRTASTTRDSSSRIGRSDRGPAGRGLLASFSGRPSLLTLVVEGGSRMKSTVQDVMTRTVVTVSSSAPFKEIATKLAKYGVSALPVIGPEGGVVGVVSEADLMLKEERLLEEKQPLFERRRHRRERAKMRGKVAGELMSAPAVTIAPE